MRTLLFTLAALALFAVAPQAEAGDCFAGSGGQVFFSTGFQQRAFFTPDVFVSRNFGVSRNFFVPRRSFGFGASFAVGVGRGPVVIQESRGLFGLRRTTTVIGR